LIMDYSSDVLSKVKRRRLDRDTPEITIASGSDLKRLLTPQRNSPSGLKTAVNQFREFLSAISPAENDEDCAKRLQNLRAYSEEQLSGNQQAATFPDLVSTWSFAIETNNEPILSLVPSALALYLNIISSHLQFRDIGLSLCRSLLMKDQLRLFTRGLTATKTKEHLISPCLQLLTEIVSFDGGELANLVYSKRDTTFRRLEVFLDQRTPRTPESEDMRQTPTLRSIAQRYLLANLRFQNPSAIGDIAVQGKILRAYLQNLKDDEASIVYNVLISLEKDIIRSNSLTKGIKSRFFGKSNLSSLVTLYAFPESTREASSARSIREQVDIVLRLVCTQQDSGILLAQDGWYPPGTNPDKTLPVLADPSGIDLETSSSFNQDSKDRFSVKNVVLSFFIQALRPEIDRLQASLLLDIFRAAPELVADYFSRKNNFIAEPKDTPAWLGQSAFLFSAIQLPVPQYCGWKDGYAILPPPSSTVIESILPRPLDRSNTTRALKMNHEVITLFAVRAVTVAFQKLDKVLGAYHAAKSNENSWRQASSDLPVYFSQRCPLAKDVLSTLQRTPKSDEQLHGAIVELIAKYYQVLPHLVLGEKFDVSLALVDAIRRVESGTEDSSLKSSRLYELENLIKIAQMAPDAKWWQKPGKSCPLEPLARVDVIQTR
jgi:nucleolar pre-ribosomal-associated protein 1